ncbi:DTW - like 2 [Theobroma cacao]|nr:DTW - like 2 [Theobroma cacao]
MEEPEHDTNPTIATSSPPLSPPPQRRQLCTQCDRPLPVCLCHVLPTTPLQTKTKILIIRHPHESRHKLNTTPLLSKTLLNAPTISSRRLLPHHLANQSPPAIYLFPPSPSTPAVTLSQLKSTNLLNYQTTPLLLIVFDATWKHAKEMVGASEGVLKGFAVRVCLDGVDESVVGGSIYDSELILRKEPFGGCVTTLEAVARCLGVIEPNGNEVQGVLIGILREMVRLQAGFLKPVKPRTKMLKKNKHKEEGNSKIGEISMPSSTILVT